MPVAGGSLAVFRAGEAHGADAIVAVHGITANSRCWVAVERLLPTGTSLVSLDLRGRAGSAELPPPYGIDGDVRDTLAVLDWHGTGRAVLVGHSLGAYVVASLAAAHPDRVRAVVLVDGGLPVPGSQGVDARAFTDQFLGVALSRLTMRFPTREAYHQWWRRHPAINRSDIADEDLVAYADHDLVGTEPELHSSVVEDAVRADATDLFGRAPAAPRLRVPATLLSAPRGLIDDPSPMQPLEMTQEWAAAAPEQRRAILVPDVNHYSIVLGARGAATVAAALVAALATPRAA